MSMGRLYERFLAQQEAARTYAEASSLAAQGADVRQWYVPDLGTGWDGDPFNMAGVAAAFSRAEPTENYQAFFFYQFGTAGDCVAAKMQSDYLACQERAYRLRHLTPVRASAHACARHRGHANAGVGVFARLTSHIQDVLVAGSTGLPEGGYS